MVFVKDSIKLFYRSSTKLLSGKNCTQKKMSYKKTWMIGWNIITMSVPIKVKCVADALRWIRLKMEKNSGRKNW